jgi:hypothetical protein
MKAEGEGEKHFLLVKINPLQTYSKIKPPILLQSVFLEFYSHDYFKASRFRVTDFFFLFLPFANLESR